MFSSLLFALLFLTRFLFRYVQSALRKDLLQPCARAWVAENDGVLLGMVAVTSEGELRRLAVHPLARGLGVARLLVARLERYARRSLHVESVFLWTGTFMFVSRFYVQCGYRHEATQIIPAPTARFPYFTTAIQLFRKTF
jgi:N-acetylglutamate synthase-like GNAT family acetyltransferase